MRMWRAVRGGFRGRGRGRRSRERQGVPNLFKQEEISQKPEVMAAPHQEEDYYHPDVLSRLGIKLTQHELMDLETTIQVTLFRSTV